MQRWLGWLAVSFVVVLVGSYTWVHRHTVPIPAAETVADNHPSYDEERQAGQMVTVSGPMADYVLRQKPANVETNVETLQPISYAVKPSVVDHVGDSPVGTSSALLHKTFNVAAIVDVPFELPAHASNPQLRGMYRAFLGGSGQGASQQGDVRRAGDNSEDGAAGVEFLLLNEQQYADFLSGHPGDALFSADRASAQEINVSMPPTYAQPAKYHLVFRNGTSAGGKKAVQADFRLDF
jgi:hypothetical protein